MERRNRSDLALIYAMLQASGIRAVDLADLSAYEVVEITDVNGDLFECYMDHGPGLKVQFRHDWIADVADLPAARAFIEEASGIEVTLIRDAQPAIRERWIPVPFDDPRLRGATAIIAAAEVG